MAAAVGRLTGKAGVALVTSGPGCSNLITGIATANSEGDPVVALGGAVLMVGVDAVARSALAPSEIPVGLLTALLGGPFFLFLLLRGAR